MNWAAPEWWWLLIAVAAAMVCLWWTASWHMRKLRKIFGEGVLARILPNSVIMRRQARDALMVTGLLLLVMALAEPRFGKRLIEIEAEGVDLVLVVDLSRSMDATDVSPSRLERARREILDLVDLFEGDRVGLVVYAGGPYPRMPLTLDYSALRMVVRELDTRTFQAQGSALGLAIRESLELLSNQEGTAGRAMVVLTDGEVHDPADALAAANEAREAGVSVYGMIIGSEPSPIPNGDGTFLIDPNDGSQVLTRPDPEVLRDVARITGGAVVQSVPSNADAEALYRDTIRPSLRTAVGRRGQREAWTSAFQWPLGLGLACLLLSAWLGDGKRIVTLVALLLFLPNLAQAQTVRDGDVAYRSRDYAEAVRVFTELTLEHPDDPELFERLGAARYRTGDYVGAARAFERQQALGDTVNGQFNAGNAYWQSGQLDKALMAYDDVLARQPEHPGATANREMLTKELQQRQLQQQAQYDHSEPKDGDENEPEDGEQGEQGDPSQGEGQSEDDPTDPGDQEQSQSEGTPGEQSQPNNEGDPKQNPGEAQQSESGDQQTEQTPGDEGTRDKEEGEDEEGGGGGTKLEDVQTDGEDQQGVGGSDGELVEPTGMTPEQADRVLDGVEEGRPRVYIPGERGSKPW